MATSEAIWRDIRALRADPPGLAGGDAARRGVFTAALQQAEELHGASSLSGFTSRPLPLFYALSQGGRAIAAARVSGEDWAYHGHGAGVSSETSEGDVLTVKIEPRKNGAFPTLVEATGSAHLGSSQTLGALLATLPEVASTVATHVPDAVALQLEPDFETAMGEYSQLAPPHGAVAIYCGPEASLPEAEREQAMWNLLEPFGRARGWGIQPGIRYSRGRVCIALVWPIVGTKTPQEYKAVETVATPLGGYLYLRPTLGENGGEINLLMSWWAVLLAMSSLARYEPSRWQAALNVDTSKIAVLLERVLDIAQERVPELLFTALVQPR